MVTILGAHDGDLMNLEDGVIELDLYIERAKKRIEELRQLQTYLKNPERWNHVP